MHNTACIHKTDSTNTVSDVAYVLSWKERGGPSEFWPNDAFTPRNGSLSDRVQETYSKSDQIHETFGEIVFDDSESDSSQAS